MGKIERFEDIVAWQKARLLTKAIYQVTREGAFARDFGLNNQIQRASVSIMSNIAEGFERTSLPDRIQFVGFAKASCAEVRSKLYVALDAKYLSQARFEELQTQAQEVARLTGKLRAALIKKRDGGMRDEG